MNCLVILKRLLFVSLIYKTNCRSISAKPTSIKKRTTRGRLKIRTSDFSSSIFIIMLQSYINAFLCSWYVSNTYHSPINVHVTSTYFTRSTPLYWSRLGRNSYGTDRYLPNSYLLGKNICSVRVPSLPIWWRH